MRILTKAAACLALLSAPCLGGCQTLMTANAEARYKPPGRIVDIGGRGLQIDCRGSGSPTVVLEAGGDTAGSLNWAPVQERLATTTRVCAYSRAGLMWSDRPPGAFHPADVAEDLHRLLAAAGETAPYVLVGHSRGGLYNLIYTQRYGAEVAGLVFVDSAHPDQEARFRAAGVGSDAGVAFYQRAAVAMGWTGVLSLAAPHPPAEIEKPVRALFPKSAPSALDEAAGRDGIDAEAGRVRSLGDRPIIVLSRQLPAAVPQSEASRRHETVWRDLHKDLAAWSTRGELRVVPDSDHGFYFSKPEVVVAAVKDVVAEVRTRATAPQKTP